MDRNSNDESFVTCSILRVFTTILSILIGVVTWTGYYSLKNSGLPTLQQMFSKIVPSLLIIFFLTPIVLAGLSNQVASEEISGFKIPVVTNAYDIRETLNKPPGTKSVFFKAKIKYPSLEVLSFYDKNFKSMGFEPFAADNYGDRQWHSFIDATRPGKPIVDQLIATWVDKDKTMRIIIGLRYVSVDHKAEKEEVEVIGQVQPFFLLPLH